MKITFSTIPPGASAANGAQSHQHADADRGAFSFAHNKAIDDLLKKFSAERLSEARLGDFYIGQEIIDEVINTTVDFHV